MTYAKSKKYFSLAAALFAAPITLKISATICRSTTFRQRYFHIHLPLYMEGCVAYCDGVHAFFEILVRVWSSGFSLPGRAARTGTDG